jgi:putative addiction module component (TIGR02574 family)
MACVEGGKGCTLPGVNPPVLRASNILAAALRLPEKERAELATELLASLCPAGVLHEDDDGFAAEVERRAERVRSGESPGLDWDEVLAELSAA